MNTYDYLSANPIFDIGNCLLCFICLLLCQKYFELKKIHFYFLSLHSILPFFINDFFMDYSYMPDQTRYIFYTDYFRFITDQKEINYDIGFGDEFFLSKTGFTSYLLSLIPMPNIMTTRSLGFANKIIFIILFSYLYKKQILTNFTAYIFLIYPSFALYSGIALKEMISVCLMILIIEKSYNFNIKQLPILIFLCFACYIVKYQFMLFIAPFVLILLINFYDFKKKGYSYLIYSNLIIFGIIIGFFLVQRYGDYINNIRYSFFIDNGNNQKILFI